MKKLRPHVKRLHLKRSKKVMKNKSKKSVFQIRLSKRNKIKAIVHREHR